ncbi:diguanylate cyclase domain-containing protein [Streptomyces sp. NPDC001296]
MDELQDQAFYGSLREQTVYRRQRFNIHDRVLSGPHPLPRPDYPRRKAQLRVPLVWKNYFKAVNDTMGHPAGDAVLTATAARLTAWAGPRASVGRLGGDEFFSELPAAGKQRLP